MVRVAVAVVVCALALCDIAHAQSITVVNRSTTVTDAQVQAALPGMQAALDDYATYWGTPATLNTIDPAGWMVTITDDSTVFGALAYHDVGRRQHKPFSAVFAASCEDNDVPWTVCATHEIEEMLADPWLTRREQVGSRLYIVEPCDPVETRTYVSLGVRVADFVTPAWYSRIAPGPFDFLGKVRKRTQVLAGGYVAYYDKWGSLHVEER